MAYQKFEFTKEPTPFAEELAKYCRDLYFEAVQRANPPEFPEIPNIPEFDPMWWQHRFDLEPKWVDRIKDFVTNKISRVAHCVSLKGHCNGCSNIRSFSEEPVYVSREYFKDQMANPLPCPKDYDALVEIQSLQKVVSDFLNNIFDGKPEDPTHVHEAYEKLMTLLYTEEVLKPKTFFAVEESVFNVVDEE